MALLKILEFPDPLLRQKAHPVATVTDEIRKLADDMLETMYAAPGIGLAATQLGIPQRVIVIDLSEAQGAPMVFINPKITVLDGEPETLKEGCLSVPGFYEEVTRIEHVRVDALDRDGQAFSLEARGLLAVCLQHEVDHLDGKLFVDYLSPLKRKMIRRKLEKQHRSRA